ncbi:MAG TPA: SEC-C domain-containing protein [Pseudonocardiaceae bacterium]|nr:SEC-C domain-containing protein [Pseudonocardiaceae bacterium]
MSASFVDQVELARQLEVDLEQYPEERGEILLEAAHAWQRAGEYDRATELLGEVIALGWEDGGAARVALADLLFELDRVEEAAAQLAALRRERPASVMPYHLAAELVEDRGDLNEALIWFTMAASRLTEQEMAQVEELGLLSYAHSILAGRRRVRRALGMPDDELDALVVDGDGPFFDDLDRLTESAAAGPREVRILFWPRPEIPRAHERWPQLLERATADTALLDRERANRELSESGVTRIVMVPLTVAALTDFADQTGADPVEEATRRACMDRVVADGGAVSWPPPRNAPCWCGSSLKYKKCCGRPNL